MKQIGQPQRQRVALLIFTSTMEGSQPVFPYSQGKNGGLSVEKNVEEKLAMKGISLQLTHFLILGHLVMCRICGKWREFCLCLGTSCEPFFHSVSSFLIDTLSYMRPNTPHFVLGIENSMMLGRHFYSASTIADSCFGLVHASTIGGFVTNQHHHNTMTFLRRILTMWVDHYMNGHETCKSISNINFKEYPSFSIGTAFKMAHIPDITTHQGLCDVMILGNIIEFTPMLLSKSDKKVPNPQITEEEDVARWKYRRFIKWFQSKYMVLIGKSPCNAWKVFDQSFAHFAATVSNYKYKWLKDNRNMCHPKNILEFLRQDWPHLVSLVSELQAAGTPTLGWTGPQITVTRRNESGHSAPAGKSVHTCKRGGDVSGMSNIICYP
jgi:hypothetical protein